jgi:hypothetical protein
MSEAEQDLIEKFIQKTGGFAKDMTLRDYFAAKAMQIMWDAYDKGYCGLNNNDAPNGEIIALASYKMADDMLKASRA